MHRAKRSQSGSSAFDKQLILGKKIDRTIINGSSKQCIKLFDELMCIGTSMSSSSQFRRARALIDRVYENLREESHKDRHGSNADYAFIIRQWSAFSSVNHEMYWFAMK